MIAAASLAAEGASPATLLSALGSLGVLVVAAAVFPGVATKTRAILTGRRGAPLWQLYADLHKLVRKGATYSTTSTWALRLAPLAVVATTLLASAIVPLDGRSALVSFTGDAVAFAYLLGLGRFLLVLGALDTGSSFEGMGASREVSFASLVEPGLFVALVALGVATHQLSLTGMFGAELWQQWPAVAPTVILLAVSLFTLMLAECARVPVDDPATHLELTMIHEVMVLDHSGPDLAFILYANALKMGVFTTLMLDLVVPRASLGVWASAAILVAAIIASGVAVGIVESSMARLRMPKVPLFIAGSTALGLFGLILLLQ
jgi:formate hydrogenlyase subunit 4